MKIKRSKNTFCSFEEKQLFSHKRKKKIKHYWQGHPWLLHSAVLNGTFVLTQAVGSPYSSICLFTKFSWNMGPCLALFISPTCWDLNMSALCLSLSQSYSFPACAPFCSHNQFAWRLCPSAELIHLLFHCQTQRLLVSKSCCFQEFTRPFRL